MTMADHPSQSHTVCDRTVNELTTRHVLIFGVAPANAAVEYEYREMTLNDTRFKGTPGPLWEQSMHELLDGQSHLNALSLPLPLQQLLTTTQAHSCGYQKTSSNKWALAPNQFRSETVATPQVWE